MDPNEALKELRMLMAHIRTDPEEEPLAEDEAADLFDALDDWLSRGGFLPNDWNHTRQNHMGTNDSEMPQIAGKPLTFSFDGNVLWLQIDGFDVVGFEERPDGSVTATPVDSRVRDVDPRSVQDHVPIWPPHPSRVDGPDLATFELFGGKPKENNS